ncbi:hypothetical protein ACIP5Y_21420 [Nocardia sp. NPDC088792]|uniref:hypothetical protein n=1 Tax=Nocardia sp. NPDC088792 TaxID=3364332 RepID=UPI003829E346
MQFFRAALKKPSSQRMYLTSNRTPTSTAAQLTGWTADGSYPSTNIVSSSLVVDHAGVINVTSNCVISTNSFGSTAVGYLYHNGSSINSASTTSTGTLNLSMTGVSVAQGDTITMYAKGDNSGGVVVAATTTYILFVSQ